MIRITTDAWLARYRKAIAEQLAVAVEIKLAPGGCAHEKHRPLCPRCSARTTVSKAAKVIRETGGVQPS